MTENKISIELPAEVKQDAINKVKELTELLRPFLIALTPDERHAIPKMGDRTVPFVEKAVSYCDNKPQFAPPYLNIEELNKDFSAVTDLLEIFRPLQSMCSNLDDTLLLCGSESYVSALIYYNSVKEAARRNVPDAKTIFEDLKKRFPGGPLDGVTRNGNQ